MVEQQPGIFREIWTLASTFLIIRVVIVAVAASLWARLPFPHFHSLIYILSTMRADTAQTDQSQLQTIQVLSTNVTSRTHTAQSATNMDAQPC
ncbi:hypothetical protein BGW80DRAFT_593860 [Lactifluus volemus]|nr:hypothetical protein BGW80DRAFT_593860 [Lactifluus volemus]